MIPLKETDEFLIGKVSKVKKIDNKFFILDETSTKSLFCFDNEGNPISKFNRIGNGPNEYVEILDFDINETKKEIAILCSPQKIFITDLELNKIKNKFTLENRCERSTYQGNDLLLYDHNNRKIYKLAQSDESIFLFFSWDRLQTHYMFSPQDIFYKVKDKLLFHSPGTDTVYIIKNNKCFPYMVLDFEHKEESYNMYKSKPNYEFTLEEKLLYPLPRIHSFFYIDDQLIFPYTLGIIVYINMPDIQNYNDRTNAVFASSIVDVTPYKNNILLGWCNGNDITSYKDIPIEINKNVSYEKESTILLEYELQENLYKNE